MPQDWSREEVEATVSDYFAMLVEELRGERPNKAEHNRWLQRLLHDRSPGAIEFKHANISAILLELDCPYIDGYKPRGNYQELLREVVVERLRADRQLAAAASMAVDQPAHGVGAIESLDTIMVPPPRHDAERGRTYERRVPASGPLQPINYLEREARNASLGAAGEALVLKVEHARLWTAGHRTLAERIEHVSRSRGDWLGYDIVSFEENGRERLIEVKTTRFGPMTPFFASRNEVAVSEQLGASYHLYRVFRFRESPRIFTLPGSLRDHCDLDPTEYRLSLR